jgi:predicted DsbA family dithiol-disulfide isomerase
MSDALPRGVQPFRAAVSPTVVEGVRRRVRANLLDDRELVARVEQVLRRGRKAGVHSTPTFFFNGTKHDGHYDFETLAGRLADARRLAGRSHPG